MSGQCVRGGVMSRRWVEVVRRALVYCAMLFLATFAFPLQSQETKPTYTGAPMSMNFKTSRCAPLCKSWPISRGSTSSHLTASQAR